MVKPSLRPAARQPARPWLLRPRPAARKGNRVGGWLGILQVSRLGQSMVRTFPYKIGILGNPTPLPREVRQKQSHFGCASHAVDTFPCFARQINMNFSHTIVSVSPLFVPPNVHQNRFLWIHVKQLGKFCFESISSVVCWQLKVSGRAM